MATIKTHALFWTLLKELPDYKEQYKEVIKEGIVSQYTNGRTCSLSEMYQKFPVDYSRMIEAMKGDYYDRRERYDSMRDKAAKRVIAAICQWIDKSGYPFKSNAEKIDYVKSIACRAANCSDFNRIELSRMIAIYNEFCKKNRVDIRNPVTDIQFCQN